MAEILDFRPFKKLPATRSVASAFVPGGKIEDLTASQEFMVADLKRSGLEPKDLAAYAISLPSRVPAYLIPYWHPEQPHNIPQPIDGPDGTPLMHRIRLDTKDKNKYDQPSKKQIGEVANSPYFPPYPRTGDVIAICEGEKKAVAVCKHLNIYAIGIGGCENWRLNGEIHPQIQDLCRGKTVIIIPDGDIYKYSISRAYGNLAGVLRGVATEVRVVEIPKGSKIDDWIAAGGRDLAEFQNIDLDNLSQGGAALIDQYNLTCDQTSKGVKTVHQNFANMSKLLREHPAFPRITFNPETFTVCFDGEPAVPGKDDGEMLEYFQRNLGFQKAKMSDLWMAINLLSLENEESPFLKWIESQVWDGQPRLETWLIKHWGAADTPHTREASMKWLVGAVNRLRNPGCKMDWMLVVIGPQRTGKTSMPDVMFKGSNTIVVGDHTDKDFKLVLHSNVCISFDELDSFGKKQMSFMKSVITCTTDYIRKPYARTITNEKRRSILYGSGNLTEFLQEDTTGQRRYAVIEVERILDFAGLEAERGQLWAEAAAASGVDFANVEGNTEQAEKFVIESKIGEMVDRALSRGLDLENSFDQAMLYAKMGIDERFITMAQIKEVSACMRAHGWEKRNTKVEGRVLKRWKRIEVAG